MKKSKAVSLLLSLSMLAGVAVPGALTLPVQAEEPSTDGIVVNKTATDNGDGTYTITLDAYATGETIVTEETKEVPTDIVLVLDQSGSMAWSMNTYSFRPYGNRTNNQYYNLRHNGGSSNLYYKLENGGYASVSVRRDTVETGYTYTECPESWKNDQTGWRDPDDYMKYQNQLYVLVDGNYQKVTLEKEWIATGWWGLEGYNRYTYTFPDKYEYTSDRDDASPGNFDGHGPLYVRNSETDYEYTYTYTDEKGATQTIGTYQGADEQPDFSNLPDYTQHALYERYQSSSTTRLQALKTAVTTFANSVAEKAAGKDGELGTEDDVDHRIAVVGFATNGNSYDNTELFVGKSQYKYNSNSIRSQYKNALQDMNTQTGRNNVLDSVSVLDANGATYPEYGLKMAESIFEASPIQPNEKRNRVVILFTDGEPGWSGYESEAANAAIRVANTLKDKNVTVYSVGIFEGADATSAGISSNNQYKNANQFMQSVSSNNGTPQNPSYYLSAADADTLNNIFQQISDQIEHGGSATTLDSKAVVKDVISDYFTLPAGTTADDIILKTYQYTGKNGETGEDEWSENEGKPTGVNATISGDTVSVTGFDFAANWCGTETTGSTTTYRGNKLQISFTVTPKAGFLGGNQVPTNKAAGVYENAEAKTPLVEFPVPYVDVPIKDVTVTAPDKNVYLLQDVTADDLKSLTAAKAGNINLNLAEEDWGLQPWQYAFVNITLDGSELTGFSDLTSDQTYTVSVTISPKTNGTSTGKIGTDTGSINVYKPELTFKDGEAWYGAAVPDAAALSACLTDTTWKHGETEAAEMGEAPELSLTIKPDQSKISDGKVNTKQDVPVAVSVSIAGTNVDSHTTFQHTACEGQTCDVPEGDKFLLHINTCQLTVTKTGGAEGEPYVFTIRKDGQSYSEVTVVGNNSVTIYELPVGSYTIEEDDGWSWRYESSVGSGVNLNKDLPNGTITCTNKMDKDRWLNDFSAVVTNVFGGVK